MHTFELGFPPGQNELGCDSPKDKLQRSQVEKASDHSPGIYNYSMLLMYVFTEWYNYVLQRSSARPLITSINSAFSGLYIVS